MKTIQKNATVLRRITIFIILIINCLHKMCECDIVFDLKLYLTRKSSIAQWHNSWTRWTTLQEWKCKGERGVSATQCVTHVVRSWTNECECEGGCCVRVWNEAAMRERQVTVIYEYVSKYEVIGKINTLNCIFQRLVLTYLNFTSGQRWDLYELVDARHETHLTHSKPT